MHTSHITTRQRRSIARRVITAAGAAIAVAVALTSCSLSPSSGSADADDKTLTVATWKGYGADLDWVVADFEKQTGATVKFQYIDSLQNMLQLVDKSDGAIDVALPNIQYIGQGIDDGLFLELEPSKLDNLDEIYPEFSGRPEISKDGKLYGVPWAWGTSGLFYDTTKVTPSPDGLSVLWDPKYKGQIALTDDPTVLIPTVALYIGEDPQNPDMAKIIPALKTLKDNAKLIYGTGDDLAKAIASGAVVAGMGASSGIGSLIATPGSGAQNLKYELPTEGGIGWIDNWAISAKSKNPDLAYEWLNYMTSKKFLSKWVNSPSDFAPAPANQAVVESLETATKERLQTSEPAEIAKLTLQLPMPEERLQSWVDAWIEVKGS